MKNKVLLNIKILALLFVISMLSSCHFMIPIFQPGYWQALVEGLSNKQETVSECPDYLNKYEWQDATVEQITELWNTEAYQDNLKNPPKKADLYWKQTSEITVFRNINVVKFDNHRYDTNICKWIYTLEDHVALNYLVPQALPSETTIKIAKDNPEYVYFITNEYTGSINAGNPITSIYKNGMLIEQHIFNYAYIVEYK